MGQRHKKNSTQEIHQEVPALHSMKAKVGFLVIIVVLITVIINLWTVIPNVRKNICGIAQNYLLDSASAYGRLVDEACALSAADKILNRDALELVIGNAGLKGNESSYAYVVDYDGIMLYHPTPEKIGQKVENTVIDALVKELAAGKEVENAVVKYDFNGSLKYASYYIGHSAEFVLVISADENEVLEPVRAMTIQTIEGSFIAVIVCVIISIIVVGKITRPIHAITKIINNLTALDFTANEGQGKLNARRDETGHMSRAITHLREELGNIVYDLQQQSNFLFQTSSALSANTNETIRTMGQVEQASHDIADGAASQANETEAATNNVVTIGNMVEATNTKVKEIHGIVLEMQKDGDKAAAKIHELDEQNEKTKESIQVIYEQTNMTNHSAQKIREATALITSIAEETSLLSLNASIEAARAGEQGRGFAVVAAQIQKLAEQSNESAGRIEEIVSLLIDDSKRAVETMEEVKLIMEQQIAAVESTGKIFSHVQNGIQNTKQGIDAIAEHTHQMDEARVKVVDVVQNLTAIAEENAASTEETSASVTQVSTIIEAIAGDAVQVKDVAERLENNISKFKL